MLHILAKLLIIYNLTDTTYRNEIVKPTREKDVEKVIQSFSFSSTDDPTLS